MYVACGHFEGLLSCWRWSRKKVKGDQHGFCPQEQYCWNEAKVSKTFPFSTISEFFVSERWVVCHSSVIFDRSFSNINEYEFHLLHTPQNKFGMFHMTSFIIIFTQWWNKDNSCTRKSCKEWSIWKDPSVGVCYIEINSKNSRWQMAAEQLG